jgi:hypothetical protein
MPGKGSSLIEDMNVNKLGKINKAVEDPEFERMLSRDHTHTSAILPRKIKINNVTGGIED